MPPMSQMVRWRAWRFPALALGLLLAAAAACGPSGTPESPPATERAARDSASEPPTTPPPRRLAAPTPTPHIQRLSNPMWRVAPSLEEQIFRSSVIVRASLQSATAAVETVPSDPGVAPTFRPVQELRFAAHEYLQGSGPTALLVVVRGNHTYLTEAQARSAASRAVRDRVTAWDDLEGVLFLETPEPPYAPAAASGGVAGAASAAALEFTQSNWDQSPWAYSVDTLSRAWLPAREAGGAAGQAAATASMAFITDGTESPPPVVSLTELRAQIAATAAELRAGQGVAGFTDCIRGRIGHARHRRAVPWTPFQEAATLASGSGAGTEVYKERNEYGEPQYSRWWLSGPAPERFQTLIIDDDDQSGNGYDHALATARPLPAGTYRVHYNWQHYSEIPCNSVPHDTYRDWTVTVTAPAGTVHEAFFDPVAIDAGVGADDANGALEPTAFSIGETAVSLQRLGWEGQQLELELSAAVALAGHYLDVIALDGSVALRLSLDDATTAATDAGGQAWRWRSCASPWAAGDQLMLRLHHSATVLSDATVSPGCGPPPTFNSASYMFTLADNTPVSTAVGLVTATPAAGGGAVTYAITAGNAGGAFAIDAASGRLTVAGALDSDTTSSYAVTVTATDAAGGAATVTVTITVTAVAADYDADDDGLIEVASLAQLHAMRWDLDGDGTSSDPGYALAFPDAPAGMGCPASGCAGYELTTDLDFDTDGDGAVDADDAYWNGGAGWAPLGTNRAPFSGTFEGNGHVIARLFIHRPGADGVGLFGETAAASVIRRVGLPAARVTGGRYVGSLAGYGQGALAASHASGGVTGERDVGGLVGHNRGPITASQVRVTVTGGDNVGGLAGYSRGALTASYAAGDVTGARYTGGLVGLNRGPITASQARGRVTSHSYAGGLIGVNLATITASYWDTTTSGQGASQGGVGQTTRELQAPTGYRGIYAGWNVDVDGVTGADDPWDFGTARQYPALRVDFDGDGAATWEEFGDQRPNRAPEFTEGATTTRAVDENPPAGTAIGDPVTATDADGDSLGYTLGGTDAADFDLEGSTGQLRTRAALDHETQAEHVVTVAADDGKGGRARITVTISVGDVVAETPPAAPTTLAAGAVTATGVSLTWDAVTGAAKYRVDYRVSGAEGWTTDDDTLTTAAHTVDDLTCNTAYEFRVSAYGDGVTPWPPPGARRRRR